MIQTLLSTLYISIGVTLLNNIPWQCIFLITRFYGLRLYTLTKKEECKRIQKKIGTACSNITDNDKGYGYSFGYWYVMVISITNGDNGDHYNITLIATESSYENLIKNDYDDKITLTDDKITLTNEKKVNISIYECIGSFYNRWYKKREIKIPSIISRPNQQTILDQIIINQTKTKHTVVFIHGHPGSGKSMIGLLLANHYNGSYCNSLHLWKPGDTLAGLYSDVEPTEDKPLILALEEIDSILIKIHDGIPDHKSLPISIQDKIGWNNLFDAIQLGVYPHLIVLITSNKSSGFINELDSSYLRKGRVDFMFELNNNEHLD